MANKGNRKKELFFLFCCLEIPNKRICFWFAIMDRMWQTWLCWLAKWWLICLGLKAVESGKFSAKIFLKKNRNGNIMKRLKKNLWQNIWNFWKILIDFNFRDLQECLKNILRFFFWRNFVQIFFLFVCLMVL